MNPREVKRYINAYTLVRKIKPYLDVDVVLALQTIAFRTDWRPIQFALLSFREAFINALRQQISEPDARHLEGLSPDLASLPQSFSAYVDAGQPGNALVATGFNLTEYLFSGEATRSTTDTSLLEPGSGEQTAPSKPGTKHLSQAPAPASASQTTLGLIEFL